MDSTRSQLYKFNYRSSIPILPLHLSSSSTFNIDFESTRFVRGRKKEIVAFPRLILFRVRRNRPLLENVGRLWERIKWHARLLESVVTIFKRELVRERANTFALVSRYERKSLYTQTLMFKRCATFKRVNADVSPPSFSLNSARGVYKHIPDDNSCFLGGQVSADLAGITI